MVCCLLAYSSSPPNATPLHVPSLQALLSSLSFLSLIQAAKHGVVGLTKVVALETAGSGVTVSERERGEESEEGQEMEEERENRQDPRTKGERGERRGEGEARGK